ncbi:hypothetical protein [Flavobacterium kingsejongi]|uniref:Uncharacterized protein n=1 Tax=Flavobacterium kingsejongi TaxID=1678728 RepID=A0A2S1LQ37_9FLAO|nr:hypothetical protein [Flavobacterium kingsejongi]AWG25867.1 hypothetical protein FK004_11870 [Flavobacterium kingsejongi]
MFTQGQWMFAAFFVVVFVIAMIYSYRKDILLHKRFYKGSYWILIGFLIFIAILFFIKYYLKD